QKHWRGRARWWRCGSPLPPFSCAPLARRSSGAQAEAERALAISPNLADAHGALGVVLTYSGRPKEGLAALKTCIRLDPRAPSLVLRLGQVAVALYFCREYAAVVEA